MFGLVRGPGAVQLVTSPAHKNEIDKVQVFDIENCRLTCFSRSGHQFVIATKDELVRKIKFRKKNSLKYLGFKFIVVIHVKSYIQYQNERLML